MSSDSGKTERQEISYLGLGMSVGMILGGLFGIVYGILLDNMAFMTIWVGGGLAVGLSIGAGLEARKKEKEQ
jgi:hypothetical protein